MKLATDLKREEEKSDLSIYGRQGMSLIRGSTVTVISSTVQRSRRRCRETGQEKVEGTTTPQTLPSTTMNPVPTLVTKSADHSSSRSQPFVLN